MFEKVKSYLSKEKFQESHKRPLGVLSGCHAAILACDGFEESELFEPMKALEAEGCETHIVSLQKGRIKAWNGNNWGRTIPVDLTVAEADNMEFDFLVLPGGVMNPDKLREDTQAVSFVDSFMRQGKPIAAICHGVQTLIETEQLEGRVLTSYPSIATDLINAGVDWIDEEVVVDKNIVTSRKPADIPAFNREMIRNFNFRRAHEAIPNTESFVSIR